jgi:cytochrome c2
MSRAARLVLALLVPFVLADCGREDPPPPRAVLDGDVRRGRAAIERHGCGACHVIPGIRTARGIVGPSLIDFARRPYIAGVLLHDTLNLLRWLQNPPAIAPGTVMPRLGVSEGDARDIAAYLYRSAPGSARADSAPRTKVRPDD